MKKALHKDFWMEIRKSKARFISIFCIVALGVAFFSGIQAASPDMRLSGDAYYDTSKLMDIKVVGTLGLTEDDVNAIREIDGVEDAEGAWSTDVLCSTEDSQKVLHVESLNTKVNQLTASDGRIPQKSGECFLDKTFASNRGYQVGDTITFEQSEDSELLVKETYTVVGVGSSPLYISFNRGNTTLGTGEINGFAYVMPEDFDQEVYTQIYVQVHGAEGLTSYTDAYDNLIEKIRSRIENIEEERCQIRYDSVVSDAEEELADAEKELEDGKEDAEKELADARQELVDAGKELADGKKEYEDGKQQLDDGKQELEDSRKTLEDGKKELEDGKAQLETAKAELADGKTQLDAAKAELSSGWAEYNSGKEELEAGEAKLSSGKQQLASGKKKLQQAKETLNQKQAEIDAGKKQIAEGRTQLDATESQLNAQKQQCEEGLAALSQVDDQLSQVQAGVASAQSSVDSLAAAAAEAQSAVDAAKDQYDTAISDREAGNADVDVEGAKAQLDAATVQLETLNAQYAEAKGTLDSLNGQLATLQQAAAQKAELQAGLSQVDAGLQTVASKRAELTATEAQLTSGQQSIDDGWKEIETQEASLKSSEAEITANEKKLKAARKKLDASLSTLQAAQAEVDANEAKLASGQAEIEASEATLAESEKKITDGEKQLEDGEKEIAENEKKLADAKKEIEDGEKELKDGWKEYRKAKKEADEEIADGEQKIEDAKKELEELEVPEWIVTDRNSLPEYSDYGDNADKIRNIGQVFPVIFFLVAALISLTTMTRMVEEQRTQIGTLKALGYGKISIASKYICYALLATVGGSVVGILIGEKILPYIIITAYGIMYHNMASAMQAPYELKYALIASTAAIVCTIGATIFSCYKELAETPASLMRPPAPKEGKRVLIERVTILWKHLNFTWKSTLRNLFRYKKRLFMTIFGISGSMALMLVGYGIQDSVSDIAGRQYSDLQHYDATIIADEDATEEEKEELLQYLAADDRIERYTQVHFVNMTIPNGKSNLNAYLYVPENLENFAEDVTLQDRITKEQYSLTDEGAVISEKTSTLLGLKVGDNIPLKIDDKVYEVKVAAITENYMSHYVYMTPAVYRETFKEEPDYADIIFTMKEEYEDDIEDVGLGIMDLPAVLSISYTRSIADQVNRMLSSLGMVIIVLIVSAGMLAFVVLYNLNNINITERQRELATLKVLGFFDGEVSQYVLRENILLTIISLFVGSGLGILLHRFVIVTVEVDAVMFGRTIRPISFLYCALFTIGFSAVVNVVMHFKLKKIDMVESLKSVE